jgi:preprotein translocase subunit SecD
VPKLANVFVTAAVLFALAAATEVGAQPSCPRVDLTLVEPNDSSETRAVKVGDRIIFVRRSAITTISDISELKVERDELGDEGDVFIQIRYTPEAAERLLEATTNRDGQRMAFVVDDDVWLAFTWEGPYGIGPNGTQLSIRNGMIRAQGLVESIEGCIAGPGAP